ncbi:endonuclease I family protein [Sedimenticola selenatireducens]|uniref:endonuclease I family protein n=1 Tax=Sedimenticola selenatireducens TaxID=191960 RepID=UPI003F4ADF71
MRTIKSRSGFILLFLLSQLTAIPVQADGQLVFKQYFEALPVFWQRIYPDGGHTLYCDEKFGAYHGRSINIEHIFPMAWAMRDEGCRSRKLCRETSQRFNRIEADMHNLYPARADINKIRSSFPFAEIAGEKREFGRCDFEFHARQRVVEPRPASRGNIARALFYMHDTYGLTLYRRQGELMKKWHREDPPDAEERRRNDLIARYQGTRNRFIDDPRAADALRF